MTARQEYEIKKQALIDQLTRGDISDQQFEDRCVWLSLELEQNESWE